jgi:3-hydroxybutyryl-CoA dehydratase
MSTDNLLPDSYLGAPLRTMDDLAVGERASFAKTITESDVYGFAGISGDFNPLHVDAGYAATTRFGGRIAHGALLTGLISAVLGMKLPGPGALYASQRLDFRRPVHIGDTITAAAELTVRDEARNRITLKTTCHNQHGKLVAEGESVLLPAPARSR